MPRPASRTTGGPAVAGLARQAEAARQAETARQADAVRQAEDERRRKGGSGRNTTPQVNQQAAEAGASQQRAAEERAAVLREQAAQRAEAAQAARAVPGTVPARRPRSPASLPVASPGSRTRTVRTDRTSGERRRDPWLRPGLAARHVLWKGNSRPDGSVESGEVVGHRLPRAGVPRPGRRRPTWTPPPADCALACALIRSRPRHGTCRGSAPSRGGPTSSRPSPGSTTPSPTSAKGCSGFADEKAACTCLPGCGFFARFCGRSLAPESSPAYAAHDSAPAALASNLLTDPQVTRDRHRPGVAGSNRAYDRPRLPRLVPRRRARLRL